MKKIFKITLFKKIFLIIFCGILCVECFHVFLDFHTTKQEWVRNLIDDSTVTKLENLSYGHLNDKLISKFKKEFKDDIGYFSIMDKDDQIVYEQYTNISKELRMTMNIVGDVNTIIDLSQFGDEVVQRIDQYIKDCFYKDKKHKFQVEVAGNIKRIEEDNDEISDISYFKIDDMKIIDHSQKNVKKSIIESYFSDNIKYTIISSNGYPYIIDYNNIHKNSSWLAGSWNMGEEYGNVGNVMIRYHIDGNSIYVLYHAMIMIDGYEGSLYKVDCFHTRDNGYEQLIFESTILEKEKVYIFAFVMTLFMSMIIAYMLTRRIKKIDLKTREITDNHFDVILDENSNDELGILSKNINTMSRQLQQTIEQLNIEIQHVKELEGLRKDFINQFTHEMKTPLGIINGYSELIEEAENDEEKQKYLDIINKETIRINELIQAMLNLSRLEAGKVELNQENIDLEDIITEIVDEYEVLLMKKKVKVEIEVKDNCIKADKKQIITVIRNFMSNAIKHVNEEGRIKIIIDQGISVYNEGEKIEEERLESIWYTFVTHDQGGSGLGLAICRSILELHGFDYGVKNINEGVEFYFKGS